MISSIATNKTVFVGRNKTQILYVELNIASVVDPLMLFKERCQSVLCVISKSFLFVCLFQFIPFREKF